jgi:hypothetical protein
MKRRDIIIGAAIIIFLAGIVAYFNFFRSDSSEDNNPPSKIEINFTRTGHLVKDNPGLKPGTWYLLYEMPGSPALTAELKFDSNSLLFVNDKSQPYDESLLYQGFPVTIEGVMKDSVVLVVYLNELSDVDPPAKTTIKLFYYDSNKDKDESGNILCSRQGLVAVEREIPVTNTPIQDSVRLLLQGNLTAQEKSQGLSTEYPLPGVALLGANLKNGILTLEFSDPQNKTGGGSCRVGVLWFQIEATAKQFLEIKEVKFKPEEIFQP